MPFTPSQIRRAWFWSIVASVAYLVTHIAEDRLDSVHLSTWIFATMILLFSLWAGRRNRSVLLATIGVTAGLLAYHYEAAMHMETVFNRQSWTVHLIAFAVLLVFSLPASLLQRKRTRTWHRWLFGRAEEIATRETAERDHAAEQIQNGYSPEPCSVRTAEYSTEELRRFARFMGDRRIGVPHWEGDSLVLYFPGERALYRVRGFDAAKTSRVAFHPEGNITAQIVREDYRQRRDRMSHAQLCKGLGNTVYDLLQRQRLGEVDLILREVHDDTRQAELVLAIIGMLVYLLAVLLYFGIV